MAYNVLSPRHVRYAFEGPRKSAGLSLGHHIAWARDGLALHALLEFDDGEQMAQTRFVFGSGEEIAFRGADRDAFLCRGEGDHLDLHIFEPSVGSDPDLGIPEGINDEAQEGAERIRFHLLRERCGAVVRRKKEEAMRKGRLAHEICRFSFAEAYGKLGGGFIECHHLCPLSAGVRTTTPDDLALICSNCHRMAHRWLTKKRRRDTGIARLRRALVGKG